MTVLSDISQRIWDMKYRFRKPGGEPIDGSIEDSWRRVARALAAPENEPERWAERFYGVLEDFQFLPAGRILAGAGTERTVTLFNCFVMGRIPDSMVGIFDHLKEAALTMQQGGGIGYDFSTLRPRGAPVRGVGADASGPLSFMDVWDAMCRTIMSAGARRGAMMATLRCDHPDIEAFVEAKRAAGRLSMFNLSVLATDPFMAAVSEDRDWDLVFDGRTYRTVRARDLWDRIMRATYDNAEPGVIFIDRVNALNNLNYCETIHATNPCVTADTWIMTGEGPRQVADLIGRPFRAVVDGRGLETGAAGFFATGRKPVLRLTTREGHALRLTADHRVRVVTEQQQETWREAGDLRPGDRVVLHDHHALAGWNGAYGEAEGYLAGLLIGDALAAHEAVMERASSAAFSLVPLPPGERLGEGEAPQELTVGACGTVRAPSPQPSPRGGEGVLDASADVLDLDQVRRLSTAVEDVRSSLGIVDAKITPAVERTSSAFHRGFLSALFDTAGLVGNLSVELAHDDADLLRAAQRMMLRLGIVSTIHDHRLVISGENLARFDERVGFTDADKRLRLTILLQNYRRTLNRERFIATVESITPDGVEPVFDVEVPGINAFDANGLYVHNCGEQPLPPYGACLLGSVNLARLVRDPFTAEARLDLDRLKEIVPVAVRMMDNVVDVSGFPLPAQTEEARAKRRIGLGVTGLADALIMAGVRYGSAESARLTGDWLAAVRRAAYLASAELAAEKGAFPLYDKAAFLDRPMIRSLPPEVRRAVAKHGIRNALVTSIAPTGTISLFADNVSSGIEPVFAYDYSRNVLLPDGSRRAERVTDYAFRLYRELFGPEAPLPDSFVDAQSLTPGDHLAIQAAAQAHVDSSISKTINCPADLPFEAFKDVYAEAYRLGCKGCTTYRPNEVTGAVLEVTAPAEAKRAPLDGDGDADVVYMTEPLDRPNALPGRTYKLRWPDSDHAIYVTVNDILQDGPGNRQIRRPFEVFINSKNMEHYAWTVALTRMISAVFRRGGDVAFVVEELKAVFDPRGGQWMDGRYVPSLLAAIGGIIERHMIDIGFLAPPERHGAAEGDAPSAVTAPRPGRGCPRCGQPALIRSEGCDLCTACGYSKCS